ncbi:MAG: acetyl-CoA hydrolase/transferase family protein [Deltaproteobacteria bacterium]|nr:acetyl-CoA hydrolase/transferase family protein [Deltaproteobacteria bacterium]
MKLVSAEKALEVVQSGNRVYVHEASMVPVSLLDALVARSGELTDVEVVHLHTDGPAPHTNPSCSGSFRHNALFAGRNVRNAIDEGRADFTPVFLSEVPSLFAEGRLPLDVALLQLSPPDEHGYCRLGLSVATARAAASHATFVVAEINPQVPRTMGDSAVHVSDIDFAVEVDRPLPTAQALPFGPLEEAIGKNVAALVPNQATLQVGIGNVPNAVMAALKRHQDLGLHTEMMSDGLVDLIECGAITNRIKTRFQRRGVCSFAVGSERLHTFLDNNPFIEMHPSEIVNDPNEVRKQHVMTAINSAIEIDITGQVCADSMGERIWSGIGGQMDFVQGALRSPGGKAIIALASTAKGGQVSRIVPRLQPGAGVVTTRGHVQWVVTEYGAVNLRGRTLRERAAMLTSIAHPDFRPELRAAAVGRKIA